MEHKKKMNLYVLLNLHNPLLPPILVIQQYSLKNILKNQDILNFSYWLMNMKMLFM